MNNVSLIRKVMREELSAFTTPQLLTAKEMAVVLKVRESTLATWRNQNRGPSYIMVEGSIRYELSALHRYVNDKKVYGS